MLKTEKNKSKGKKLGAKLVSVILTLNLLALLLNKYSFFVIPPLILWSKKFIS